MAFLAARSFHDGSMSVWACACATGKATAHSATATAPIARSKQRLAAIGMFIELLL
jgi:hypothetical protein